MRGSYSVEAVVVVVVVVVMVVMADAAHAALPQVQCLFSKQQSGAPPVSSCEPLPGWSVGVVGRPN